MCPRNGVHVQTHLFHPVRVGTPSVLHEHGDRNLLLVWPPLNERMGADCLRNWSRRYVFYVGEGYGDCTGDDAFHETLAQCFREVDNFPLSTWPGVHDSFFIYERRPGMNLRRAKKMISRIRRQGRKQQLIDDNNSRRYRFESPQHHLGDFTYHYGDNKRRGNKKSR